jgi:hypothetical protein
MKPENENSKEAEPKKKYMFLGYGGYGAQPNPQFGGGYVRNPAFLEKILQFLGLAKKKKDEEQKDKSE